jgi:sulfite exporter TauE/SafE
MSELIMTEVNILLLLSAFTLGLIHTLMGPDHYIPFIVMARARNWSLSHTIIVTFFAGVGHVSSACALGFLGIFLGLTIAKLNLITSYSVSTAAWLFLLFGLLYLVWGIRYAARYQQKKHEHSHSHSPIKKTWKQLTPWILFTIFILGPCEPLIPLMFYPALQGEILMVTFITLLFGLATIIAMLTMVIGAYAGIQRLKFPLLQRYGNAAAGMIIFLTGCVIKVFSL